MNCNWGGILIVLILPDSIDFAAPKSREFFDLALREF